MAIGNRVCLNRLLKQTVEHEAARTRRTPVKVEHEFVYLVF